MTKLLFALYYKSKGKIYLFRTRLNIYQFFEFLQNLKRTLADIFLLNYIFCIFTLQVLKINLFRMAYLVSLQRIYQDLGYYIAYSG